MCLKSSQRLIKLPLTAKAFPLTLLQFETEIYFTKLLGVDLIRQFIKNTAITQRGTNFLVLSLNSLVFIVSEISTLIRTNGQGQFDSPYAPDRGNIYILYIYYIDTVSAFLLAYLQLLRPLDECRVSSSRGTR